MRHSEPGLPRVDRYLVRDLVGRGSTGLVYTAVHERASDQVVAVKLLVQPQHLEPFRRTASAIHSLDHPGIVRRLHYFELPRPVELGGELQAVAGLVMPYLPAGSLADSLADLRRGGWRMDLPDVTRLLRRLVEALEHAHERGFLHRDIKPSNVVFHRDGQPVLTDVGLELPAGQAPDSIGAAAPLYASPEQIAGAPLTPASDVYSLGVMLYEMVTNELPYRGVPGQLSPDSARHMPPRPASQLRAGLPQATADTLSRALARQPEARFEAPESLLRAWLASVGEGSAVSCSMPGLATGKPRFVSRDKESSALGQAFVRSRRGRPAFLLLSGEEGIGKTALVEHFVEGIKGKYPDVLVGRGGEAETATRSTPFSAFSHVFEEIIRQLGGLPTHFAPTDMPGAWKMPPKLRALCKILTRSAPGVVNAFVPGIGLGVPVIVAILEETGLGSRATQAIVSRVLGLRFKRLHSAAGQLARVRDPRDMNPVTLAKQGSQALVELSREHPLVLVLDCMEQLDGDSWRLLQQLLVQAQEGGARILVVGCMRPEEPWSEAAREAYASLRPRTTAVTVGQDEPRAFVTHFVRANAGGSRFDPGFLDRLTEHTGANPSLLTATLNYLDGEGLLALPEQRRLAGRPEFDALQLPAAVEPLLESRVGQLDERSRTILEHASVQGRVFVREVLASTLRSSAHDTWHGLAEDAINAQVGDELCKVPQLVNRDEKAHPREQLGRHWATRHHFANGLLRDYLYGLWDATTRRIIHRWAGLALEQLYGESAAAVAPQLAYHFAQSEQEPMRALLYASRVAQVLYDRYSMPAVHEWCDLALQAAAELSAARGGQDSHPDLPSAAELQWQVREIKGDAFFFDGQWEAARTQYETLLQSLPSPPQDALMLNRTADMLRRIGEAWRGEGEQATALEKFREALAQLEGSPLAAPAQIALLQREIGYVLEQESEVVGSREALQRYKVALSLVEKDPDEWALTASLYTCCGCVYERRINLEEGEEPTDEQRTLLAQALEWHNRAIALRGAPVSEEKGMPRDRQGLAGSLSNRAIVYEKQRDWVHCEGDHQEAIRLLEEIGHVVGLAMARLNYGEMLRQLNRPAEAAREYRESLQAFIQVRDRLGELIDHLNLSLVAEPLALREAHGQRAATLAALDGRWEWLGFVVGAYEGKWAQDGPGIRQRMREWLAQPAPEPIFAPESTAWGTALADHARLVERARDPDWAAQVQAALAEDEEEGEICGSS